MSTFIEEGKNKNDENEFKQFIAQGAEARVWLVSNFIANRDAIIKERFPKKYRIPELDKKLTTKRVVQEVRCMVKCRKNGIDTPVIYMVDQIKNQIYMEHVQGKTIKDYFRHAYEPTTNTSSTYSSYGPACFQLAKEIGAIVASIHDADLVHGDLTTSNFMLRMNYNENKSSDNKEWESICVIDFGLGYGNPLPEDKAVDLYVLERAFTSTHRESEELVQTVLNSYFQHSKMGIDTKKKFEEVRLRGRKRECFG